MKDSWTTAKLSDVATVQSGSGFPEKYQGHADHDIPFYKVSDMNLAGNEREMVCANNTISEDLRRQLGASIFPEGSTIFPKIGGAIATNKKRLTGQKCCVDNNVMGVIPKKDKIDRDFLFYFFLAHDLSQFANEAHLPSIKKTVVEGWEIKLPTSLLEQQRIVGILDEVYEGIATAKANAEKNFQNARALFDSELQSVFTERGEAWLEKPLIELCSLFVDSAHRTPKYQPEGIPALRPRDVVNGKLALAQAARVSKDEEKIQSKRHRPAPGDIAYSRELSYGWAAILPESPRVCLSQGMCLFRPLPDLDSTFLLYVLNGPIGREQATRAAVGAAHPHINLGDIKSYRIPLPPLRDQVRIIRELDAIAAEIPRLGSIYERKLAALESLKKSLLHQAFTGQL